MKHNFTILTICLLHNAYSRTQKKVLTKIHEIGLMGGNAIQIYRVVVQTK